MQKEVFVSLLCAGLGWGGAGLHAEDYDARARAVVSQMTLAEKITELHGIQDTNHYRYVPPIPRLGIPEFHIANGPAGVGPAGDTPQKPATALPAPISLAATWDVELAKRYGVVLGRESRDLDEDLLESPDINIARVPQNGRTFEAFGEDPWLVARLAVAQIEGIQSQGIIANVKHFAANNQESARSKVNVIVDERTLHELYLPAFEASVKEASVASVMGAYNKVNGTYCCENTVLLDQILKRDWGFKGFVTSDFGAVHSTAACALAGLDLEMPTGKFFGTNLEAAVISGKVPMAVIDDKLIRRFRTMMEYGLFDHPLTLKPVPAKKDGAEAERFAEAGVVLLKNAGNLLPLNSASLHSVAIIGPAAMKASTGGGGSSQVVPLYSVDPVAGIRQRAGSKVNVTFADGTNIDEAVALAKSAEVAVVMIADNETEGRDHTLTLSGNQDALVAAVSAANPRTVVVLKTGSAAFLPWLDQVPAVLEAWYPGEEDGHVVAKVLFGDVNPSGKLPITFPRRLEDFPAHTPEQYPGVKNVAHYSEGVFVGYRHYDADNIEPLFPFGYGLSYTTYAYKHLTIHSNDFSAGARSGTVTVDFEVANTGPRAGEEIAQLYVGFPSTSAVPQPLRQLKAFAKVSLRRGHTRHVRLTLDARALSYWDVATHDWKIQPGTYHIMVGSSSRDLPLEGSLSIN